MDAQETITVAITSQNWYDFLLGRDCRGGVNFWRPSKENVRINPGEWFLFKQHSAAGRVMGGAQFLVSELLTIDQAWSRWGVANGCADKNAFLRRLLRLRTSYDAQKLKGHSYIRCLYLSEPVFLDEGNWFDVPGWNPESRQPIRKYDASNPHRSQLQRLIEDSFPAHRLAVKKAIALGEKKDREGQFAFRREIIGNYQGQCAITGEKTEPVLEAAHIEPYARSHNHLPSNGLLFKSDIHRLFDRGLVSVTPDRVFHVSPKIKEEWKNGKYYYQFGGQLIDVPERKELQPDPELLQRHFEKEFQR